MRNRLLASALVLTACEPLQTLDYHQDTLNDPTDTEEVEDTIDTFLLETGLDQDTDQEIDRFSLSTARALQGCYPESINCPTGDMECESYNEKIEDIKGSIATAFSDFFGTTITEQELLDPNSPTPSGVEVRHTYTNLPDLDLIEYADMVRILPGTATKTEFDQLMNEGSPTPWAYVSCFHRVEMDQAGQVTGERYVTGIIQLNSNSDWQSSVIADWVVDRGSVRMMTFGQGNTIIDDNTHYSPELSFQALTDFVSENGYEMDVSVNDLCPGAVGRGADLLCYENLPVK